MLSSRIISATHASNVAVRLLLPKAEVDGVSASGTLTFGNWKPRSVSCLIAVTVGSHYAARDWALYRSLFNCRYEALHWMKLSVSDPATESVQHQCNLSLTEAEAIHPGFGFS